MIECYLEQRGIVSGYNDTALTIPGDVILRGYLCRAAILPVSTTETRLRSLNPVLQQSKAYVTGEGETLSSVASEQNLSLSLLRQVNPELSSWPSTEPLAAGTTLLLPVYRSTTPIPAGLQLLVPGYLPSTQLPAGEWIYLPARRSAPSVEEGLESLG